MYTKDFLSITDLTAKEIRRVLAMGILLKQESREGKRYPLLSGNSLVMIFEKPSLRTRLSFEIGMTQMGGHAVYLAPSDIGVGKRESIADVARVASSMGEIIMARTFSHNTVTELARFSSVPVINGLSDLEHPCQILADLLTILEQKGSFCGLKLAYVGDSENNVTHSLALASVLLGMHFIAASPSGYRIKQEIVKKAQMFSKISGGSVTQTEDAVLAVSGSDIVYTDTWVSMGDESERDRRLRIFPPYQVDVKLMKHAKQEAIFMHDLPAHRGEEVTAEVIDGKQSVVFQQAENRLHAQKALIYFLLHGKYDDFSEFEIHVR